LACFGRSGAKLHGDPSRKDARAWDDQETPTPAGPTPVGEVVSIFSPRRGLSALKWYAARMDAATESVFLTAAFGVSKELGAIFEEKKPYLRYLLLDKPNKVTTINRNPSNRIVAGGYLGHGGWRQWLEEALTDLNKHVRYVHTKYMLSDPLGADPIVISGSANFSEASTTQNDENMLVVRGDTRLADMLPRRVHAPLHPLPLPRQDQHPRDPAHPEQRHARAAGRQEAVPARQ
jgi:phosphatidylserine/phosphatidylglycerophosphate/cardiolipin synthase-like enzyme